MVDGEAWGHFCQHKLVGLSHGNGYGDKEGAASTASLCMDVGDSWVGLGWWVDWNGRDWSPYTVYAWAGGLIHLALARGRERGVNFTI